jgi:flavin reductase (DIM6/NTAB) family NADH-FMN oxidoreductase RutF
MSVEVQEFRDLMAGICAPVTIVTTMSNEMPYGATVSAFASLSLEPPMVSVALDRRSQLLGQILQTRHFGVNVLTKSQEQLARVFASRDIDRFALWAWSLDGGLPRLAAIASWMVCKLAQAVEAGDHKLLLGVVEAAQRTPAAPLVYAERSFGTHSGLLERESAREWKIKQMTLLGGDML